MRWKESKQSGVGIWVKDRWDRHGWVVFAYLLLFFVYVAGGISAARKANKVHAEQCLALMEVTARRVAR